MSVSEPRDLTPGGAVLFYTHGGGMIFGSAQGYHTPVSAYARDLGVRWSASTIA